MGPRPFGRGMIKFARENDAMEALLQWGRDLSVAEWRRRWIRSSGSVGFNGAATFRSRNAANAEPKIERKESFNGAATFRSRNDVLRRHACRPTCLASMGPRPFGRGMLRSSMVMPPPARCFNGAATFRSRNALTGRSHAEVIRRLQWGRDLSVAECG